MTMMELVVGIFLLATLALVMSNLFRVTMAANLRTASEATALQAARIALDGNGPYHGFVFDTYFSSSVYAANTSSMTLLEINQSTTLFNLINSTLTVTNSANDAVGDVSGAPGLSGLTFAYYTMSSSFLISSTTTPSDASFVTIAFSVPRSGRTLQFYSGSGFANQQLR
jgi:type II secretory pathway pseudopilin PulG